MVASSLVGRAGCSQQKPPKLIMNRFLWLSTNMGFAEEKKIPHMLHSTCTTAGLLAQYYTILID
jgi:hypothetical protein